MITHGTFTDATTDNTPPTESLGTRLVPAYLRPPKNIRMLTHTNINMNGFFHC